MSRRRIVVVVAMFAALLGVCVLWSAMVLPFSNPLGVVGPLTIKRFNPANNVVRYLVFVTAPAVVFVVARGWELVSGPPGRTDATGPRWPLYIVCAFIAARVLQALTFAVPLAPLDLLHDGETLSAAYNLKATGGLWTSTFFVHGLFYDPLSSRLAWALFGHETIGAMRLLHHIVESAALPCLCLFVFAMVHAMAVELEGARRTALAVAMLSLFVVTEQRLQYLDMRDSYALIAAGIAVVMLRYRVWWAAAASGLVCGVGFFNTIERGAYVTLAALCALALVALLRRERRDVVACLAFVGGVVLAFVVARGVLGAREMSAFAANLRYWVGNKELMDGYVYPRPFSRNAIIFAWPLVINALSFLGWTAALPTYVRRAEWTRLTTHTFIVAAACLFLRSGLGRCDDAHVRYVSTFAYLALAYTLVVWAPLRLVRPIAMLASSCLVVVTLGVARDVVTRRADLTHLVSNARAFVALDDARFLPDADAVAQVRERLSGESCSFVYPLTPAMHYLLKKPSCTRFYFTWFATAVPHQEESIRVLEERRPERIVWAASDAKSEDNLTMREHYPALDAYIQTHYAPSETFGRWTVAVRARTPSQP